MTQSLNKRHGYRGYITSKPFMSERVPQHIQNLVIRDYASRNKLSYLLSATEYAMKGSHMILDQILGDLPVLEGVICYSVFQLPLSSELRQRVYLKILKADCHLHFAVEELVLSTEQNAVKIEDIWRVRQVLSLCPSPDIVRGTESVVNISADQFQNSDV